MANLLIELDAQDLTIVLSALRLEEAQAKKEGRIGREAQTSHLRARIAAAASEADPWRRLQARWRAT